MEELRTDEEHLDDEEWQTEIIDLDDMKRNVTVAFHEKNLPDCLRTEADPAAVKEYIKSLIGDCVVDVQRSRSLPKLWEVEFTQENRPHGEAMRQILFDHKLCQYGVTRSKRRGQ